MTEQTGRPGLGWGVVATGLLTFLLLVTLERAFAMIFVLNFSTGGPGPTVFLVGLFLSGFLYPLFLHRWWPHPPRFLDLTLVVGSDLVLVSLFPQPAVAALAALVAFAFLTPLVFTLVAVLRARFADGVAFGLLLHLAGRAWLDTAPFAALASGWVWTVVVAVALFAVWTLFVRGHVQDAALADRPGPRAHLVTPILFLMYAFLGMPVIVRAWLELPFLPTWGAGIIGLLLGFVALRLPAPRAPLVLGSTLVFILALADLLLLGLFPLVVYPLALASSLHLLGADTRRAARGDMSRIGTEVGIVQAVAMVALFLHAVAPSWAFLPEPVGGMAHGRAPAFLLILGTLGIAALLVVPAVRESSPLRRQRVPSVPEGPFALGVALAVLVAAGGAWVHDEVPPVRGAAEPTVRVATYNVHQYFSGGQTGHYNLEEVAAVIRESGAQVIGLQESDGARVTSGNLDGVRWLAHELDMHYDHGPPTAIQIYGVAILSAYPILASEWIALPNTQSVERAAIKATLETPYGPMTFVVTHFQTEEFAEDRVLQTERIVSLVAADDRAWVVGDFNTPPKADDPAYRRLTENFTDAWVASGRSVDSGPTMLDDPRPARIDHIHLKGEWDVSHCATYGDLRASDHLLVACDLLPADLAATD